MDRRMFLTDGASVSAASFTTAHGYSSEASPGPEEVPMHLGTQRGSVRLNNPEVGSMLAPEGGVSSSEKIAVLFEGDRTSSPLPSL